MSTATGRSKPKHTTTRVTNREGDDGSTWASTRAKHLEGHGPAQPNRQLVCPERMSGSVRVTAMVNRVLGIPRL